MNSCISLLIAVFFIEVQSISALQTHHNKSSEPLSPVYVHTVTPLPISTAEWRDITVSPSQIITAESSTSEAPTEINLTSTVANKINKTKSTVTNRTRTIQRLVGGHLQHQAMRNDTLTWSDKFAKIYFRRKTSPSRNQPRNHTTRRPPRTRRPTYKDPLDDAALLEVDSIGSNGIDNWDSGLLRASAGAGKEASKNGTEVKKKEEKVKTLSDQVAEGKYGLIQKEIFQKEPKRPGVISYLPNPETPGDNNKTYGGLSEDDIWLAEDHLLVLKGGNLNKHGKDEWRPIDAYEAPLRQVKIPPNPEVPPPFPVQLEENGPIEFIGNSQVPVFNPFANESLYLHPGATPTPPPIGGYPPDILAGSRPPGNSSQNSFPYPPPIPPWFLNSNTTFANPFLNPPPFFAPGFPPPPFFTNGSLENVNITEFDEDDPSLYYPPPYSFVYKSNYNNPVPPGPLVPGIVLPPPPNFFSRLEGDRKSTTQSPVYPSRTTKLSKQPGKPAVTKLTTTTRRPEVPGHLELHKIHIPRYKDRENVVVSFHPTTSTSTTTPPTTRTTVKSITTLKKVTNSTPNVIQFIPKIKNPSDDLFRGSNPIYFEYFDARKSPHTYLPPATESTTPAPPQPVAPVRTLSNREKPIQAKPAPVYREHTTEQPALYLPEVNGFDYDKYLYITPQPEIQPNGYTNFGPLGLDYGHPLPIKSTKISTKTPGTFNQEIETIRQTLKYYKNQIPSEVTQLPRTPKAKAVYEYSFDAVEGSTLKPPLNFNNPIQIDTTPFKPMVQYSAPLGGDINGFRPFGQSVSPSYYTTTPVTPAYFRKKQSNRPPQRLLPILQASTENPLPTYYTKKETALLDDITKKYFNIFGQKLSLSPEYATEPMSPERIEFTTATPEVGSTTTPHWISIEKQVFRELDHQTRRPNSHRALNYYSRNIRPIPLQFDGYHYDRPEGRPFPAYYQNPSVDPYMRQIALLRQKLRQYQPQQQQRESTQQYDLGYVNDTYVKFYEPRPNKDNEFLAHQNPPPLPHYQQILNAPNRYNYFPNRQVQEPQAPISLHKDTLVNYKYPLPAVNPDSEFIPPKLQQQQQHKQHQQYYNNRHYGNPVIQYQLGEQSHVYFITPQDNKYKD